MTRLFPLLVLTLANATSAGALELDEQQTAVWQMEETYWRLVASGNVEDYVALWHDDFVGWPCFSWTPAGKANIGSWVEEIRDNNWTLTYELKPEAVQLFGDVAVVHYAAEYIFGYGDGTSKGKGDWRKFTHTWMKVGDDWKIIGGMCADQKPVQPLTNEYVDRQLLAADSRTETYTFWTSRIITDDYAQSAASRRVYSGYLH